MDKSGSYGEFALGYDAGVSPAGSLYLLVKFDKHFQADRELVYEIYWLSDNERLKSGDEMKDLYKAMLELNGNVLVTIC